MCAAQRAALRVRLPARRAQERAGAGHHHRHGALLLQDRAAPLHHPRRPGPRRVPQEHDHRRLARRGGAARHRRARGRAGELQAARLHPLDARHPPDRRAGQQDGPARLGPGRVRGDRRRVRRLPRPARRAPDELHPDQRARRRQHRRARRGGALVRRARRCSSRSRTFKQLDDDLDRPFRMPLQDVYKFTEAGDDRRIFAGTIETGRVRPGDEVVFLPSGKRSTVKTIEALVRPAARRGVRRPGHRPHARHAGLRQAGRADGARRRGRRR